MEKLKVSLNNNQARNEFIDYWAKYVRTHSDKDWGSQHTKLINAMMQNAKHFQLSRKEYLELKGEFRERKQLNS